MATLYRCTKTGKLIEVIQTFTEPDEAIKEMHELNATEQENKTDAYIKKTPYITNSYAVAY